MLLPFEAPGISASPSEENMRYFNVMILGPTQSPYEGIQLITPIIANVSLFGLKCASFCLLGDSIGW